MIRLALIGALVPGLVSAFAPNLAALTAAPLGALARRYARR